MAPLIADKKIAQVAKGMANEVFEEAMLKDNELFRDMKRCNPHRTTEQLRVAFVRVLSPRLVEQARATLAAMLRTNISEDLKSEIYDALIRDASLRKVRSKRGQLFTN